MKKKKKRIIILGVIVLLILGGYGYIRHQIWRIYTDAGLLESWSEKDGQVLTNISYGEKTPDNLLDIYIPQVIQDKKESPQQLVLFIHGGSWIGGDKQEVAYAAKRYAKEGYITATSNYTLYQSGDNTYSADLLMKEINNAIIKIKQELADRGYTISKMAISGDSAGGHLALLYALREKNMHPIPISLIFVAVAPTNFYKDTRPYGNEFTLNMINQFTQNRYSLEDFLGGEIEADINKISPASLIDETTPPILLAYGGKDETIGPNHYPLLVKNLEKFNIPYWLFLYPNSGHLLSNDTNIRDQYIATIKQKLMEYLR